ncbi:hypothetical protein Salat_2469900 [Sesamum alatum]|uniref:Uncharacterized protein n=1 Tax=Sesamum alatum TaxID=300844 RepID=A0AAE1XRV5_9LAMI|nr:hypothetical protein Salat_2469900 [Sesamum alatum]
MASSPAYLCAPILPFKKSKFSQSFQVRAHYYDSEGNMVDPNVGVLRERIEDMKRRERLERCCLAEPGWNYAPIHKNYVRHKRDGNSRRFLQLVGTVAGTFGLTVVSCSVCLCVVSLLVQSN